MFGLNNLPKKSGKNKKRVGRGNASSGTYSGRGQKGQRSRSGGSGGLKRLGAKSWVTKLPKIKGIKSRQSKPELVDIKKLDSVAEDGSKITPQFLKQIGLISKTVNGVKILGNSQVSKKFTVKNIQLSAAARQAIEKAGGKVESKKQESASPESKSDNKEVKK